jgi:iron complex outermembrane receptor protein
VSTSLSFRPDLTGTAGPFLRALTLLLGSIGSANALADDAAASADSSPAKLEEVLVAGTKYKDTFGLDDKRSSLQTIDGLSEDQLQKLPVTTVADALENITGVSVTPNDDNERGRNFQMNPAIRGLDSKYNNVSIDGLPIATANFSGVGVSSRSTPLDMLPVGMVRSLVVYKTWSPDRDPASVGGGIELRTRSAFDNGGAPLTQLGLRLGHNQLNDQPVHQDPVNYRGDLVLSRVFGSNDQFGWVVSGSYEHFEDYTYDNATTDSGFYNFYNNAGQLASTPSLSNGIAVPQQSKAWVIYETNKRAHATSKLEFRPTDRLTTYLTLGYYYDANDATRNETILTSAGKLTNQAPTTGTYSAGDVELGGQYSPLNRITYQGQAGGAYAFDGGDTLELRFGDSHSLWRQPQFMVKYINGTANSPTKGSSVVTSAMNGFNYVVYEDVSHFNMNPAVFDNLANYGGYYWRFRNRDIDTYNDTLTLDYDHNANADSRGWGWKVGADLRENKNSLYFNTPEYDPNVSHTVLLSAPGLTNSTLFKLPGYSNLPLTLINVPNAFAYLNDNMSQFHDTNQNAANNSSNFHLREEIYDGYGMIVYNTDRLHAMAGIRGDDAHLNVAGFQQLPNPPGVTSSSLANTPYPAFRPVTVSSDYINPLPAAAVNYSVSNDVLARAAITRTIGRPDYGDYSPGLSVDQDPSTGVVTIRQGNPNLKPRKSTNYDLGTEWYFAPESMLAAAFFYKDIQDEIFTITSNSTTVYNNVPEPAVVTEPVNASKSSLKGLELEWLQGDFGQLTPWLKGVSTDLNYTLLDGSATVPSPGGVTREVNGLINQPKYIANAILNYQYDRFVGTVTFNRTGRSLRALNTSASWDDVYWAPRQTVNLKFGYRPAERMEVSATVTNLTNDTVKSVTGPDKNLLKDISYVGRVYTVGFIYRP